jgi:hypothetical protein
VTHTLQSYHSTGVFQFDDISETYLVMQAGVGLQLNDAISVTPTIVIPVGSEMAETAFSLQFSTRLR